MTLVLRSRISWSRDIKALNNPRSRVMHISHVTTLKSVSAWTEDCVWDTWVESFNALMIRNLETKGLIRYRLFFQILGVYGWECLNNFKIRKDWNYPSNQARRLLASFTRQPWVKRSVFCHMIHCRSITEPKKIEKASRKMALTNVKFIGALTSWKRYFYAQTCWNRYVYTLRRSKNFY